MENKNFLHILKLADQIMLNPSISKFEQDAMKMLNQSSLMCHNKFPLIDTYVVYKDKDKKDIEKIKMHYYLAGYRKEDIDIQFNESTKLLTVSGDIKDENLKYFPKGENIERQTHNAAARKFKVSHKIVDYDIGDVEMEDGVLIVELNPNEDRLTKKITIK